jgi:sirohydrochlorin cobaltochelatase
MAGGDRDSGVLVLGHGSRDPTLMNRAVIERNAQRLTARGYKHTEFAFNEFCTPGIKESIEKLASEGVNEIICLPLFIAMGLHLGVEIPEQIGIPPYSDGGEIDVGGRKIKVKYTRPLEDDPRLVQLVLSKAKEFLDD